MTPELKPFMKKSKPEIEKRKATLIKRKTDSQSQKHKALKRQAKVLICIAIALLILIYIDYFTFDILKNDSIELDIATILLFAPLSRALWIFGRLTKAWILYFLSLFIWSPLSFF